MPPTEHRVCRCSLGECTLKGHSRSGACIARMGSRPRDSQNRREEFLPRPADRQSSCGAHTHV